jgi:5-methylthioadenosine/S-adenosylhomocysteine deaminase
MFLYSLRLMRFLFALLALSSTLTAQKAVDLAISGGTVLTMNATGDILEDGYVAIAKDRIIAIGSRSQLEKEFHPIRTIHATGQLVMPGLINTHTHVPMSLLRGIADDLPLKEWLEKYIFPAEAKNVTPEFVYWGALLGDLEMIQSGVTTFADMYYFEDQVARATKQAGLRAVLGETWLDFPAPDNKSFEAMVNYTTQFLKQYQKDSLITPAVAPHAPFTVSPAHLMAAKELADQYHSPILIHVAETKTEDEDIKARYHASPVQHLKNIGFLEDSVVAAHCVWVDDQDIATLKAFKVGCAHNPSSNMMLASGVAPVMKMIQAGLDVGLGTDGPAGSNNDFNLFEEMDLASKLQKISLMDPKALPARQSVELATLGGARVLNLEKEIGSLEVGKKADVIVVDLNRANAVPLYDYYAALTYSIKGCDVDTSIIDGRIIMRHRRVLTLNEDQIFQKAREFRARIFSSLKVNP